MLTNFLMLGSRCIYQRGHYLTMYCADSCFKGKKHGRILTGDVRIFGNNKQRNFLTNRSKDLGIISIKFMETMSEIFNLNSCRTCWCTKHGIHKPSLSEFKQNVLLLVDETVLELSGQLRCNTFSILKEHSLYNKTENAQNKDAITPSHEAINNVVLFCQRLCAEVLNKT